MKILKCLALILMAITIGSTSVKAQVSEPYFIGEAFQLKNDSSIVALDKEIADFTKGLSWSANSWSALSIEIGKGKAQTRFSSDGQLTLVVRAVDTNYDPLTVISVYKFESKKNKRTVVLREDNSGTFAKGSTNLKDLVPFNGKKFGTSSYLIELKDLKTGEYGIIVSHPNNRTIVSCFGID